jgi:hypothetical protein
LFFGVLEESYGWDEDKKRSRGRRMSGQHRQLKAPRNTQREGYSARHNEEQKLIEEMDIQLICLDVMLRTDIAPHQKFPRWTPSWEPRFRDKRA